MSDTVYVDALPDCDVCTLDEKRTGVPAEFDGKTTMGPWANMCARHFALVGIGLGTGRGQRLVLRHA